MIRYAFITSALKFALSLWAVVEVTRVLIRMIRNGATHMHAFWLLLSIDALLIVAGLAGGWYSWQRAGVIFLCDDAMPALSTMVSGGINMLYALAALIAGMNARKVRLSRDYADMPQMIGWGLVAMLALVLLGGTVLRHVYDCDLSGVL